MFLHEGSQRERRGGDGERKVYKGHRLYSSGSFALITIRGIRFAFVYVAFVFRCLFVAPLVNSPQLSFLAFFFPLFIRALLEVCENRFCAGTDTFFPRGFVVYGDLLRLGTHPVSLLGEPF